MKTCLRTTIQHLLLCDFHDIQKEQRKQSLAFHDSAKTPRTASMKSDSTCIFLQIPLDASQPGATRCHPCCRFHPDTNPSCRPDDRCRHSVAKNPGGGRMNGRPALRSIYWYQPHGRIFQRLRARLSPVILICAMREPSLCPQISIGQGSSAGTTNLIGTLE